MSHQSVGIFWLGLTSVEVSLDMSWQVTVSGVVDILCWEVVVWFVELVKLLGGKMNVILNTIAILVVDLLAVSIFHSLILFAAKVLQLQSNVVKVLWASDIAFELGKLFLIAHLDSLKEHQLIVVKLSASQTHQGANCKFHFNFSYIFSIFTYFN